MKQAEILEDCKTYCRFSVLIIEVLTTFGIKLDCIDIVVIFCVMAFFESVMNAINPLHERMYDHLYTLNLAYVFRVQPSPKVYP